MGFNVRELLHKMPLCTDTVSGSGQETRKPQLTLRRKTKEPSQNAMDTTNTERDLRRTSPETKTERKTTLLLLCQTSNSNLSALICETSRGFLWFLLEMCVRRQS